MYVYLPVLAGCFAVLSSNTSSCLHSVGFHGCSYFAGVIVENGVSRYPYGGRAVNEAMTRLLAEEGYR